MLFFSIALNQQFHQGDWSPRCNSNNSTVFVLKVLTKTTEDNKARIKIKPNDRYTVNKIILRNLQTTT